jgi:hypothetical protein
VEDAWRQRKKLMLGLVKCGLKAELIGKLEWDERTTVEVNGQVNATL